jgi:hypothetical protein
MWRVQRTWSIPVASNGVCANPNLTDVQPCGSDMRDLEKQTF